MQEQHTGAARRPQILLLSAAPVCCSSLLLLSAAPVCCSSLRPAA